MKTEALEVTNFSTLSGIMLLAGTCIGAGMLALPLATGVAGFYPSLFISLCCWLVMLATGLLFLEATLWMGKDTNLLSMAKRFLGPIGKFVAGICFLFLYYCLVISYMAGGAPIFRSLLEQMGIDLSGPVACFAFAALFGTIVHSGAKVIGRLNWIFMMGLFFSYLMLLIVGSGEVQAQLLKHYNWKICLFAAPTLFSAYGYHNIIPTLTSYMRQNVTQLRVTIIVGTAIPFAVYTLWQWMVIGSIPQEELALAAQSGQPIHQSLQAFTNNQWLSHLSAFFGLFALVTSLMGVSLSMVDFLADGLRSKRKEVPRYLLCLIVFLPAALFAVNNPTIFYSAIRYAGGFGEAILNGLIPIAMVWIGRYFMKLPSRDQLPGGRLTLTLLAIFICSIIALEAYAL